MSPGALLADLVHGGALVAATAPLVPHEEPWSWGPGGWPGFAVWALVRAVVLYGAARFYSYKALRWWQRRKAMAALVEEARRRLAGEPLEYMLSPSQQVTELVNLEKRLTDVYNSGVEMRMRQERAEHLLLAIQTQLHNRP